ncbi:MAG: flagellar export chaperone FlgN [Planctomycetota bacterium]
MSDVDREEAEQLVRLAAEELKLYRQLASLLERQIEAIDRQDNDQLMKVVALKQGVLERAGEVGKTLSPWKTDWEARRGELPEEARTCMEEAFRETGQLLEGILRDEDQCRTRLESRRSELVPQMQRMNQVRRASKAYGSGGPDKGIIEREG